MRIFLTGATGFLGTHLVRALSGRGDECVVLSRSARNPWGDAESTVRMVRGDPAVPGPWQRELDGCAWVINLAGERIIDPLHRWTTDRKRRLVESRVATTANLVNGIRQATRRPAALLSTSAVGYYGSRGDDVLDESASAADDFLGRLAQDWEEAALAAQDLTLVTLLRMGIVLGIEGGALPALLNLFRTGLGGPWGDGRQWWSWIHVADVVGLTLFAADRALAGPINLTAPNPVTVNEFARVLGRSLGRPAFLRAPSLALRLALGESADALLDSQRVRPRRALEAGYGFRFPQLAAALEELLRTGRGERGEGTP